MKRVLLALLAAISSATIPGVPESNWLPSAAGKPFSLTFRTDVPKDMVLRGWAPPAVTPVNRKR